MNMPCYFKHPCFAQRQIYSDVMGLMLQGPSFAQAPSKAWHVLQDSEKAAVLLLLNSEMAVLMIWVGPVGCQLYLLICTDLSDNLPLQSHWATEPCLWHSGEDLNCCRSGPTPAWGPLWLKVYLNFHPQPGATGATIRRQGACEAFLCLNKEL